jgi:hypothetical protein
LIIILGLVILFVILLIFFINGIVDHWNFPLRRTDNFKFSAGLLVVLFAIVTAFQLYESSSTEEWIDKIAKFAVIILFASMILVRVGQTKKVQIKKRYELYYQLIVVQKETQINEIAQSNNTSPSQVLDELNEMIAIGLLPDIIMDAQKTKIIGVNGVPVQNFSEELQNQPEPLELLNSPATESTLTADLHPKSVECGGCGSRRQLSPGESVDCEYCSTQLSYN